MMRVFGVQTRGRQCIIVTLSLNTLLDIVYSASHAQTPVIQTMPLQRKLVSSFLEPEIDFVYHFGINVLFLAYFF